MRDTKSQGLFFFPNVYKFEILSGKADFQVFYSILSHDTEA